MDAPPPSFPPDLDTPPNLSPADLLTRVGMAPEMVAIDRAITLLYSQPDGVARLMEHRALTLGRMAHYLESRMLTEPAQLSTLGQLYVRLVECERREWEAEKAARRVRSVGKNSPLDLAAG